MADFIGGDAFYGIDRVHVRADRSRKMLDRDDKPAIDLWLWRLLWPTPETEKIGNRHDLAMHVGKSVKETPDLWVPHKQEYILPFEPTIHLDPGEAKMLMDSLWRAGVRPSEIPETAGAMKAMDDHISDLRASGIASRELASKILDRIEKRP